MFQSIILTCYINKKNTSLIVLYVIGNGRQHYSPPPFQMTLVSGLKLLRTVLVDRHSLPQWFASFVVRAGILATFSVVFLVGRVLLMKGGPDIFNRYALNNLCHILPN